MTHQNHNQRGFTLIEVLIAALILSIGLLGLAGLQARGLQFNQSAYQRTQATILAYSMADRLRNNVASANGGSYDTLFADAAALGTDCEVANCNPGDMAAFDLFQWKCALDSGNACPNVDGILPNGQGQITRAGTVFTISVQWLDDRSTDSNTRIDVSTVL